MQDSFDFSIIVFVALAVFVGWRLYSVLGTRPDRDPSAPPAPSRFAPRDVTPPPPPPARDEQVIDVEPIEKAPPAERWKGVAEPDTPLARALDAVAGIESDFDVKFFLNGSKAAYEAIVMAFATGDRSTLKDLLSRDVFENFSHAIAEREKRGETVENTFVSLDKAILQDAQLKGRTGQMTVRFESQLITVTRDANGKVVDGAADKVVTVNDVWTFARELGSRDPVWRLIATETA